MKQREVQNSVCGAILGENVCVSECICVVCYMRVSLEEFTEIGKKGCFWEGG